jgi:hypothetical protein
MTRRRFFLPTKASSFAFGPSEDGVGVGVGVAIISIVRGADNAAIYIIPLLRCFFCGGRVLKRKRFLG